MWWRAPSADGDGPWPVRRAAAAVAVLVGLVYLPVLGNGFVNWDDDVYVGRVPTAAALVAAFARIHASGNWHPLTTLSHAVDHAVWGPWPPCHHLTSLVLHGLNAGLVVLLCCALLGTRAAPASTSSRRATLAASAAAGLLWGLHPLRVEAVAWVSERKELLCTLCYLLGVLAYLRFTAATATDGEARASGRRWYLGGVACLALALLAKPMAVSFLARGIVWVCRRM